MGSSMQLTDDLKMYLTDAYKAGNGYKKDIKAPSCKFPLSEMSDLEDQESF